jgi:outer membrane protein
MVNLVHRFNRLTSWGNQMKVSKIVLAGGLLLGAVFGAVQSADAQFYAGDKLIRMRALGVIPDVSVSGDILDATASITPELDLTYFLTSNLSVEVIAGVTETAIKAKGPLAVAGDVGDAWILPPTVMLQYHLGNIGGINPYVGVGVNYTVFFNQHGAGPLTANKLDIDNAWGLAVGGGFDMPLGNTLFLNVDVKKIFLETDAHVSGGLLGTGTVPDVQIDPLLIGVGIGYRLGGPAAPLK